MADRRAIVTPNIALPLPDIFPHAVKANGMVFVSGNIGLNQQGIMVAGGVQEHTHQIIQNFQHILEAAGSDLSRVVKVNVFLADMKDFAAMNEVYVPYFKKPNLPCRTCVAVKTLPFDTDVEMECTALSASNTGTFAPYER